MQNVLGLFNSIFLLNGFHVFFLLKKLFSSALLFDFFYFVFVQKRVRLFPFDQLFFCLNFFNSFLLANVKKMYILALITLRILVYWRNSDVILAQVESLTAQANTTAAELVKEPLESLYFLFDSLVFVVFVELFQIIGIECS